MILTTEDKLYELIARLPKAELHLHLEGSIQRPRLARLLEKYCPEWDSDQVAREVERVFSHSDFPSFLDAFKGVCLNLRAPEDYLALFEDLILYFRDQNVRYAEILFTPSIPWKFGFEAEEILDALLDRSAAFEREGGVKVRWILDNVRQFGPAAAERTARLAFENLSRGVVGIGLGGDENSLPLEDYEEVFAWARANGLYAHVHAGEIGDPGQVWGALKILGANRIGHGIQAARDPELMGYLRDHAIALDVCLTSNARTGAWSSMSSNPFWLLQRRGVPVTLNTDDPGLFETTLNAEYGKAVQLFDLGVEELSYLVLQGVRSAFLPHTERMELMQVFLSEVEELRSKLVVTGEA